MRLTNLSFVDVVTEGLVDFDAALANMAFRNKQDLKRSTFEHAIQLTLAHMTVVFQLAGQIAERTRRSM
jgi:hypothetical protein